MTKPWDKYRQQIIGLYKEQNLPLHEVRRKMKKTHKFEASTRAYRTRLDKWGITKYNCQRRRNSVSTWSIASTSASPRMIQAAPAGPPQYHQPSFADPYSEPAEMLDEGLYMVNFGCRKQINFTFPVRQNREPYLLCHAQPSPVAGPADQPHHGYSPFMFPHDGAHHYHGQSPESQGFLELEDVEHKAGVLKQEDES